MCWDNLRTTLKMRASLLTLYYIYALKAQPSGVIQTPAQLQVKDGDDASFKCTLTVAGTRCYTVIWSKIDPRTKKLIVLENRDNKNDRGGERNSCPFTINKAKADDSGTYYCTVVHGAMTYFGGGSTLIVTQENRHYPPQVDVLWPRYILPRIPLLCVVSGVVPSQVRVFWVIDGEEDSGLTQSLWTKDGNGIVESTQNQILVPAEEWERGVSCTCVVEFEGKNTSKSVNYLQGNSEACTMLLFGVIAGAGLTIIVAISLSVYLYRGRSVRREGGAREQRRTTDLEQRHRSGRQGRESGMDLSTSEVQYATLEEASLARRPAVLR